MSRYRSEHDDRDRSQHRRSRDRSQSRDQTNNRGEYPKDIEREKGYNNKSASSSHRISKSPSREKSRTNGNQRSRSRDRRSRSRDRRRSRSRDRSTANNKRRRSRSRSPRHVKREVKAERRNLKNEYDDNNYYNNVEEIEYIGYGVDSTHFTGLSQEEIQSVRTCYCSLCQVTLGDPASMLGHVRGMKHIQAKKDKGIMQPDVLQDNNQVDTKFWIKQENEAKKKIASNDPVNDLSKIIKKPAKFNARNYDHGQFKKDMYCEICGVTVHSRDTFENHIQGAEHKRRALKPKKFECRLCYIIVPCQNSLNSHFQGKDHIKRVNEINKRKGIGYDDNAQAPNSITKEEEREYKQLEVKIKNLRREVDRLREANVECKRKHKDANKLQTTKKELKEKIEFYKKLIEEERNAPKQLPVKKKTEPLVPKSDEKDLKLNGKSKEEFLHPADNKDQVVDEKKVKAEFKPKKEEFVDKDYIVYDVIDIDD